MAAIIGEHLQGLQSRPANQIPGLYLGNDLSQGKRRSPLNAEVKIITVSEGGYFFALSVLFWTGIRLDYQGQLLQEFRLGIAIETEGAAWSMKRRLG